MKSLVPVEYNNQRVLTTEQLAESYETDAKHINNNFSNNKDRYTPGKHYFYLEGDALKEFLSLYPENLGVQNASKIRYLYLWTKKGAFMHAKSLNTDKAWEVYENLVDGYFSLLAMMTERENQVLELTAEQIERTTRAIAMQRFELRQLQKVLHPKPYQPRQRLYRSLPDEIRYQIPRFIERRHIGPSATDLQNYMKRYSRYDIEQTLSEMVKTGELQAERTAHTVRYTFSRDNQQQLEA